MTIQQLYDYIYTLTPSEFAKIIINCKSKEKKGLWGAIEDYISKIQQEEVMSKEWEIYAK